MYDYHLFYLTTKMSSAYGLQPIDSSKNLMGVGDIHEDNGIQNSQEDFQDVIDLKTKTQEIPLPEENRIQNPQENVQQVINLKTKIRETPPTSMQGQAEKKAEGPIIRTSTRMMKEEEKEIGKPDEALKMMGELIVKQQEVPDWINQILINLSHFKNEPKPKIKAEEVYKKIQANEINYYLPCYVRLVVKEITHINVAEMQAEVLGTLLFTFYYGDLDEKILSKFTHFGQNHKPIFLEFNKQDALQLKEGLGITIKHNQTKKTIQYVIRKRFKTSVIGDVFLTPFQIIQLYLSVTVQTLKFNVGNQKVSIKFNCMSHQQMENIISHENNLSLGNYKIISSFITALFTTSRGYPFKRDQYTCSMNCLKDWLDPDRANKDKDTEETNQSIDREKENENQALKIDLDDNINQDENPPQTQSLINIGNQDKKDKYLQYAHFKIPMYKYPLVAILSILLPIQILGGIGLFTFFQSPDLGARLATIAVLILAFVAFMPTINQSIPQTRGIKLLEIAIILHLAAIILLGAETFLIQGQVQYDPTIVKDYPTGFKFYNFDWKQNGFYISAAILNILSATIFITLLFFHQLIWEPLFKEVKQNAEKKTKFNRKQWKVPENQGYELPDQIKGTVENLPRPNLKVGTLNYCGILDTPFEFYSNIQQWELAKLSRVFRQLIPAQFSDFKKDSFKWGLGKVGKQMQRERYSNLSKLQVGIQKNRFLNQQEFKQVSKAALKKLEYSIDKKADKWKNWEEEASKTIQFDFMVYHAFLAYVFGNKEFKEVIKNEPAIFRKKMAHYFQANYLKQSEKLQIFKKGYSQMKPDVFFVQEYSKQLFKEMKNLQDINVVNDKKEDSMIVIKENSFKQVITFEKVCDLIADAEKREQIKEWGQRFAIAGADNFIFICAHLSSKKEQNQKQIQQLKTHLLLLKSSLPKPYQIILGGDLNSFLKLDPELSSQFQAFPEKDTEYTTMKKRTYLQPQFDKAEKEIKESKDRIITTGKIIKAEISYIGGEKAEGNSYLPTNEHPFDHLLCQVTIERK